MSFAIAILGLAALILLHEAGHFFTARGLGMRPRKFYLGFPPALVKTTRNGIEYGIGAIPLGGYVKIPGMHRPAPSDVDLYFGSALREEPSLAHTMGPVKRHLEAGDLVAASAAVGPLAAAIEEADLTPGAVRAAKRGFTELGDGFGGDAYWRAKTWKRVLVIFAGPGANFLIALVLFAGLYMAGAGPGASDVTRSVGSLLPNHPAQRAGLHTGDTIVAVAGHPTATPEQVSKRIRGSKGKPITLTIERNDRLQTIGPLRAHKENGTYLVGFSFRGKSYGVAESSWKSVHLSGVLVKDTVVGFGQLVHQRNRDEVSGTVGIVQVSSDAARQGYQTYLWILGLISLSLAVLNLLPLLPLDGGHIVFSLIEGIRGRSVGRGVYERASAIGIALVLLLFFVGLSNDIGRLGG
jgi:regulator of sigma E protease